MTEATDYLRYYVRTSEPKCLRCGYKIGAWNLDGSKILCELPRCLDDPQFSEVTPECSRMRLSGSFTAHLRVMIEKHGSVEAYSKATNALRYRHYFSVMTDSSKL